jgi:hypothetical protein
MQGKLGQAAWRRERTISLITEAKIFVDGYFISREA